MTVAQVLIEETSPDGNLLAVVEQDPRCAYLYLHGAPELNVGMRACWVRNLAPAPAALQLASMKDGRATMLPAAFCAYPDGARRLRAEDLRLVWLEEGDAVALLEREELLAVIPGWSGEAGCSGYARDCTEVSRLCWPLGPARALRRRVRDAEAFWASWSGGAPWPPFQKATMAALEAGLGPHAASYAADGGAWPPRALLRIPRGDATVAVTCGIGLRPMPRAEQVEGAPRRVELGLAMATCLFEPRADRLLEYLGAQSTLPWDQLTWFGPGHTLGCDVVPSSPSGTRFEALLLVEDTLGAPPVALSPYRGDPVRLLWLVPITAAERALARSQRSEALVQRLRQAGHGVVHRDRDPVA